MFRIYLQAQTKKSQIRGLDEGKLDHQRLHVAATGSNLIFKDQSSKLLPETAIELMIDMSGSMNANLARTSAIILSEALNSIPQIKLSISGFTTNDQARPNYNYLAQNPNSGRQNGMDILQFKNFLEPYQKARAKLGAIRSSGMTPLGDAYGKSLEHIISRQEPRRIIFVITDGEPEFTHGKNHSDYLLMKKVHLTAKKYGIQTLGLGIGNCEFLNSYFDKAINITNIENLPKNLLEALKFFI
jgi:cobalamin biosynthesis protein CobT